MEDIYCVRYIKEAERLSASREGFVACSYLSVGRESYESRRQIEVCIAFMFAK
jgi:hypothetical protein